MCASYIFFIIDDRKQGNNMNFNSERSKKHEELSSSAVIGENF